LESLSEEKGVVKGNRPGGFIEKKSPPPKGKTKGKGGGIPTVEKNHRLPARKNPPPH